jgi:hypothetical protein
MSSILHLSNDVTLSKDNVELDTDKVNELIKAQEPTATTSTVDSNITVHKLGKIVICTISQWKDSSLTAWATSKIATLPYKPIAKTYGSVTVANDMYPSFACYVDTDGSLNLSATRTGSFSFAGHVIYFTND